MPLTNEPMTTGWKGAPPICPPLFSCTLFNDPCTSKRFTGSLHPSITTHRPTYPLTDLRVSIVGWFRPLVTYFDVRQDFVERWGWSCGREDGVLLFIDNAQLHSKVIHRRAWTVLEGARLRRILPPPAPLPPPWGLTMTFWLQGALRSARLEPQVSIQINVFCSIFILSPKIAL